jgi:hypothetical protein
MGKRLILEQGWGWVKEDGWNASATALSVGILRLRKFIRGKIANEFAPLRMTDWSLATQLPSLLARFQEISSPMVELVLETGCL